MLCFICDTQRIKSIWMPSSLLTNLSFFYVLLHPWYGYYLSALVTCSPKTDLLVSTARTDPRSLWVAQWNATHQLKKTFSPPIVENTLPTVNRSATNRGAVKRPKPLEGDEPPFCWNICCSEGTWLIIPGVDVKAEYGHDVMCCRPNHLRGKMRWKELIYLLQKILVFL